MHYLFLILLLPSLAQSATTKEVNEARESIKALMAPLLLGSKAKQRPEGGEKFRIDRCERHKINWNEVIIMRTEVTLDYKFKEGCDLEGSLKPKVFSNFPTDFKLRNLENYNRIRTDNRITADLAAKPIMNLEMSSGILSGPRGEVKFEANYKVRVNPIRPKAIEENLGGEIRILEIYGQKSDLKEKIMIK
jgi:hypothetical protein